MTVSDRANQPVSTAQDAAHQQIDHASLCSGAAAFAEDPQRGKPIHARLSAADRALPFLIFGAMAVGVIAGRVVPGLPEWLDSMSVGNVSVPVAVLLLWIMYPVLAGVRYRTLPEAARDRRFMALSITLVWLVAPALMFTLAWVMLSDLPEYRTGVILVGLAPCIGMVLVWNLLAGGDNERATLLVVLNSAFQLLAIPALAYFYLTVLPGWLGLDQVGVNVSFAEVAVPVAIFVGIPILAGLISREIGVRTLGETGYRERYLDRIGPTTLYGLLALIVMIFALQGDRITSEPLDVARIAAPLLAFFLLMWCIAFAASWVARFPYRQAATIAFTSSSNNFELAIAIAIGTFGTGSGEALAGTVGPLIEIPVLVGLVYLSLWAGRALYRSRGESTSDSMHLRSDDSRTEALEF